MKIKTKLIIILTIGLCLGFILEDVVEGSGLIIGFLMGAIAGMVLRKEKEGEG